MTDLNGLALPDPEDAQDERLLAALERTGWICLGVSPNAEDPSWTPPFAYTAGLERTWSHPELLVSGVEWPSARALLDTVVERIRAGERFEAGPAYDRIVEHGHCLFQPVSHWHRTFMMTYTSWLYGRRDFRAWQLVVPGLDQEMLNEDPYELEAAAAGGDLAAATRLGDVWWRYRDYPAAERFYLQALEGGRTEVLVGLGLTRERAGDFEAAREYYARADSQGDTEARRHLDRVEGT